MPEKSKKLSPEVHPKSPLARSVVRKAGAVIVHQVKARRRGAVMVEYALLLTFFAVPVCAGLTAASLSMLEGYRNTRKAMLAPFP